MVCFFFLFIVRRICHFDTLRIASQDPINEFIGTQLYPYIVHDFLCIRFNFQIKNFNYLGYEISFNRNTEIENKYQTM